MQVLTFDGALAREVVLEQILALVALEETGTQGSSAPHISLTLVLALTPTLDPPTDNAT